MAQDSGLKGTLECTSIFLPREMPMRYRNRERSGVVFRCPGGDWRGIRTVNASDTAAWSILPASWNVQDNQNALLYECSVVDTLAVDPVIPNADMKERLGIEALFEPDWAGQPQSSGAWVSLGMWQYTDGTLDPAKATFDNLELRTYDVSLLVIEDAVRLQWPASAFPFTVEGPLWPVLEPVFESGGVKQVTVPASDAMRIFRLK